MSDLRTAVAWIWCVVAMLLTGCVQLPPSLADARHVSTGRSFQIERPLLWQEKVTPSDNVETHFGLSAGEYVAVLETDLGVLYKGPARCVMIQNYIGYEIQSGGVWVPKDRASRLRLFFYAGSDQIQVKTRDEALAVFLRRELPVPDNANIGGPTVITLQTSIPLNQRQAAGGSILATGVANALVDAEAQARKGRPYLTWQVSEPSLEVIARPSGR